jgi:hypothetical protein
MVVAYATAIVVLIGERSIRYNCYLRDTPGDKDTMPPKGNRAIIGA